MESGCDSLEAQRKGWSRLGYSLRRGGSLGEAIEQEARSRNTLVEADTMKVGDLVFNNVDLEYAIIIDIWGGGGERRSWQNTNVTLSSGAKVWAGYVKVINEGR
tara:strand:+ start:291 stop:602 length:312 start_codon:yes stop_codon:yes gene_type:complete